MADYPKSITDYIGSSKVFWSDHIAITMISIGSLQIYYFNSFEFCCMKTDTVQRFLFVFVAVY